MFKTAVFALILFTTVSNAASPPRVRPDSDKLVIVVNVGTEASLKCPVTERVDYVKWFHGVQSVPRSEPRFRLSSKGALKIQHVGPQDAGRYRCQAINGYGVAEANFTLVVVEETSSEFERHTFDNLYPDIESGIDRDSSFRPRFKSGYTSETVQMQRPEGSSARLRCQANGNPRPKVTWLKDGIRLEGDNLEPQHRKQPYSLFLNKLQVEDSGLYTCMVYNQYGVINANFSLIVIGRLIAKPELLGLDPVNKTVLTGEPISLMCKVKSQVKPLIQWLKFVNPKEIDSLNRLIVVAGQHYKILTQLETMLFSDNVYLTKLHYSNVTAEDGGKYICMAANSQGLVHRESYITVFRTEVIIESKRQLSVFQISCIVIASLLILSFVAFAVGSCRNKKSPDVKIERNVADVLLNNNNATLQQSEINTIVNKGYNEYKRIEEFSNKALKQKHYHKHYHHHHIGV